MAIGTAELAAQDKPNFAGKWTMVPDPAAPPPAAGARGARGGLAGMLGGGLGEEATITQDAKTLTVTRTTQAGETKTVYNLDGSESKNELSFGRGRAGGGGAAAAIGPIVAVSKATWNASKLVISTTVDINGNVINSGMTMSMNATGGLMVESTNPGRQGAAATTTTSTYKKGT
jgi:hypothetical protein